MAITIHPMRPDFAGEVAGVDLRTPISKEDVAAIEAGMDRYAVLVFRDQRISDDQQMAAVVPESRWVKGVGKKGTIIFADTRGFHKGGLARGNDRTLYIAEFLSQAAGRGILTSARGR